MKPKIILCLTLAFTTAGCDSEQRKAEDGYRKNMLDPDSAQFRNFTLKGDKACIEVNGKNSFGGYVGFQSAFLKRNKKGEWSGWSSGDLDYEYCLKDLDKVEPKE
jgi:hypothetical protein